MLFLLIVSYRFCVCVCICMCDRLAGYILSLVLLTLPRQHLVKLYLYVLTALLLFAGHQVSRYAHTHTYTILFVNLM